MNNEELKEAKAVIDDALAEHRPEELTPLVPMFPKAEGPTNHVYYRIYSPESPEECE